MSSHTKDAVSGNTSTHFRRFRSDFAWDLLSYRLQKKQKWPKISWKRQILKKKFHQMSHSIFTAKQGGQHLLGRVNESIRRKNLHLLASPFQISKKSYPANEVLEIVLVFGASLIWDALFFEAFLPIFSFLVFMMHDVIQYGTEKLGSLYTCWNSECLQILVL